MPIYINQPLIIECYPRSKLHGELSSKYHMPKDEVEGSYDSTHIMMLGGCDDSGLSYASYGQDFNEGTIAHLGGMALANSFLFNKCLRIETDKRKQEHNYREELEACDNFESLFRFSKDCGTGSRDILIHQQLTDSVMKYLYPGIKNTKTESLFKNLERSLDSCDRYEFIKGYDTSKQIPENVPFQFHKENSDVVVVEVAKCKRSSNRVRNFSLRRGNFELLGVISRYSDSIYFPKNTGQLVISKVFGNSETNSLGLIVVTPTIKAQILESSTASYDCLEGNKRETVNLKLRNVLSNVCYEAMILVYIKTINNDIPNVLASHPDHYYVARRALQIDDMVRLAKARDRGDVLEIMKPFAVSYLLRQKEAIRNGDSSYCTNEESQVMLKMSMALSGLYDIGSSSTMPSLVPLIQKSSSAESSRPSELLESLLSSTPSASLDSAMGMALICSLLSDNQTAGRGIRIIDAMLSEIERRENSNRIT